MKRWSLGLGHPSLRTSARCGFTLVEVLVSITVLAVVAIAIQRAVVVAANGTARADRIVAAEMVARTLLSGPLGTGGDATRQKSGKMNGLFWSMRFAPLERSFPPVASDGSVPNWAPVRVLISVARSPTEKPDINVQAIRLVRIAAP